jgi:hypothetical protein
MSSPTSRYFGGACDNIGDLYACGIARGDIVDVSHCLVSAVPLSCMSRVAKLWLPFSSSLSTMWRLQVFQVNPSTGVPTRTQTIVDPSPYSQYTVYFGQSVAMSGTVMVVGAYYDRSDSTSMTYTGAAYIYLRSSTSATTFDTTTITRMLHPSPTTYDYCGSAVAGTIFTFAYYVVYWFPTLTCTSVGSVRGHVMLRRRCATELYRKHSGVQA